MSWGSVVDRRSTTKPDCLMFKIADGDVGPYFRMPPCDLIDFWRARGYALLVSELEIRQQVIEDTRQADEDRFKP